MLLFSCVHSLISRPVCRADDIITNCRYQDAIVRQKTPFSFVEETIGSEMNRQCLKAAVILDTIARWLYAKKEIIRQ